MNFRGSHNISQQIWKKRYLGNTMNSVSWMPYPYIVKQSARNEVNWEMLVNLNALSECFWTPGQYDPTLILDKMHRIYVLINDEVMNASPARNYPLKASLVLEEMVSLGGIGVMLNYILGFPAGLTPWTNPAEATAYLNVQKRKNLDVYDKIRFLAIQLIHTISNTNSIGFEVSRQLGTNTGLMKQLFEFLGNRLLSYISMLVLEDLMVHREEALYLEAMQIDTLINALSLEQFGSLCRVLSFAVVDMSSEPEELLWAIDESKKCKKRSRVACEKNIAYLSSIIKLVPMIVEVITHPFESNHRLFMEYLGAAIDVLEESSSPAHSLIASLRINYMGNQEPSLNLGNINTGGPNDSDMMMGVITRMEFHKDFTMRVEGCILLIGLLYGNCRNSVIQQVRMARLIPKINDSFSFFFNPANGPLVSSADSPDLAGDGTGESIVQSLRIQILRLLHGVCDQTVDNSIMMTIGEIGLIQEFFSREEDPRYLASSSCSSSDQSEQSSFYPLSWPMNNLKFMCGGGQGLLSRVLDLCKMELTPVYRFWVQRAIESFLRGTTLYPYQIFLSENGLIQNTVKCILNLDRNSLPRRTNINSSCSNQANEMDENANSSYTNQIGTSYEELLQCSFDLLAQIVKFNCGALQLLSDYVDTGNNNNSSHFAHFRMGDELEDLEKDPEMLAWSTEFGPTIMINRCRYNWARSASQQMSGGTNSGDANETQRSRSALHGNEFRSSSSWSIYRNPAPSSASWSSLGPQSSSSSSSSSSFHEGSGAVREEVRGTESQVHSGSFSASSSGAVLSNTVPSSSASPSQPSLPPSRSVGVLDRSSVATSEHQCSCSLISAGNGHASNFDKFINIIFENIIDSNMFVRCIILSLERFKKCAPDGRAMTMIQDNLLMRRFSQLDTRIKYMCRILNCINVDTLTQDNVSCLNTTLAILLFANDNHQLPLYLQSLLTTALQLQQSSVVNFWPTSSSSSTKEPPSAGTGSTLFINPCFYFKNLIQLCQFWRQHYLPDGQDVKCLVDGSGISFQRWRNCVDLLLVPDETKNTSLIFYSQFLPNTQI